MSEDKKKPDLTGIPTRSGSYLMKDKDGKVLYVGKAINLRSRVKSYFRQKADHTPRIKLMVTLVEKVDFIVTDNEVEALILENILIKKEKPRFNVLLKDDKTYPYLKLTIKEKFPRLFIVRKVLNDGELYFGPYISSKAVRRVKRIIHKIFPLRESKDNLDDATPRRACLNYQMKRCLAPCSGKVTEELYGSLVKSITSFLKGKDDELIKSLKKEMAKASDNQKFEEAGIIRDQLRSLATVTENQRVDSAGGSLDEDYIASICRGGTGVVRIMMVRNGKLVGDQNFVFKKADDPAEMIEAFIKQFYHASFAIPSELIVNVEPFDSEVLTKWLAKIKEKKTEILIPQRGRKKKLLNMVLENAEFKLLNFVESGESLKEALREVKEYIGMDEYPAVMECVDISNTQGINPVGSLVSFHNGEPNKKEYKKYKIKSDVTGDYAMIAEVVERRFARLQKEEKKFPDLLVIDGGIGQVSSAWDVVKKYNPEQALIGIAKGSERENSQTDLFYKVGSNLPLPFPPACSGRFLLQRLRDEAHRFAITYHRQKRDKMAFASAVNEVKGFGPKRKKKLIKKFGSLKSASKASVEEISQALSINEKLAGEILEKL